MRASHYGYCSFAVHHRKSLFPEYVEVSHRSGACFITLSPSGKKLLLWICIKTLYEPCDPCVCPLPVQLLMVRVICYLATKKSTRGQPTRHQVMTL